MQNKTWHVIINPASGRQKSARIWEKIKPVLFASTIQYNDYETQKVGHAVEIAASIIRSGGERIMIIGGDGTANEVMNGIFSVSENVPHVIIAMISTGTGNDWVRTIGKITYFDKVGESLLAEDTFLHDVGIVFYHRNSVQQKRYFINIAGLGFEGMVAKKMSENKSALQGTKIHYWMAILRSLFFYQHRQLTFIVDNEKSVINTMSVAAGICKYNGGGLKQLPDANCEDGILDMTVIGNMSKIKMILSLPKLTNGSFIAMKEVQTFKGKEFSIDSDIPVYVETDGEYIGETPVRIVILPAAISILKWK